MADNGVAARRAAAGLLEQVLGEGKMLSEALGAPYMLRLTMIVHAHNDLRLKRYVHWNALTVS